MQNALTRASLTSLKSHTRCLVRRSMATQLHQWRFAPLSQALGNPNSKPLLKGIVFDVDGTLCEPQNYMFREMREILGILKSVDILEKIESLPAGEQAAAQESIRAIERRAMQNQRPQPGLVELIQYLDRQQVRKAICTRNFDEPVNHLLRTFLPSSTFSPIITRAFKPPKPDPAGILHIANEWGIENARRAADLIMVGDSIDDMIAGSRAGAATVLLVNKENEHLSSNEHTDISITRLDELIHILEAGDL